MHGPVESASGTAQVASPLPISLLFNFPDARFLTISASPPDRTPKTVSAPNPESGFCTGFMSAPPHDSSLKEVLVARPVPKALDGALNKVWMLPDERGCLLLNHPSEGDPNEASANSDEGLLAYLKGLVSLEAKGTKGISLLGV